MVVFALTEMKARWMGQKTEKMNRLTKPPRACRKREKAGFPEVLIEQEDAFSRRLACSLA
ncbi:hypothetical protein [Stutzerimonas stutzeri]|uniref:hypothetical protein n=1 Tax=Stutzerimonas stutzeri TaxID=316 RepID=UPI001C2EB22F|nr:hypothetical protein [Stutzerimonas stutzeri]